MLSKKITLIILVFLSTMAYAILRYNVFKHVPYSDIPLYISNKAFAWSSAVILVMGVLAVRRKVENATIYFQVASVFISVHAVLSFLLLPAGYFTKIYENGHFYFIGQIALLAGALAYALWRNHLAEAKFNVLILLLLFHLGAMGYSGWFAWQKWPGFMPPITLLAAITVSSVFFFKKR